MTLCHGSQWTMAPYQPATWPAVRSFLKALSFKLEKIQFMKRMKNLLIEAPSRKLDSWPDPCYRIIKDK